MAELYGWIKVHRKILHSDFYKNLTGKQRDVIITILLMANSEEKEWKYKGKNYKILPGQVFTSLQKIADQCGRDCNRETVRTTINNAIRNGFLTQQSHATHTVLTIENWETYQGVNTDNTQNKLKNNTEQHCVLPTNKNKEVRKNIYSLDSDELRLSTLLYELILENNPKFKEPNLQIWCESINKMIRIDKRSLYDIEEVIKYSQNNEFWWKNILSTSKLRKQFDRLYSEMPKNKKVIPFKDQEEDEDGWSYI